MTNSSNTSNCHLAASLAKRVAPVASVALLVLSISCVHQQPTSITSGRTDARVDTIDRDVEKLKSDLGNVHAKLNRVESELAALRSAAQTAPTTAPATLPSDSTTLPARVPAP